MLDENKLSIALNEAFRNIHRRVEKVSSITINFHTNEDGTIDEPTFTASGGYDNTFDYTSVKLEFGVEIKALVNGLKEKAESQLSLQRSLLKDKLRDVLLKAATEV